MAIVIYRLPRRTIMSVARLDRESIWDRIVIARFNDAFHAGCGMAVSFSPHARREPAAESSPGLISEVLPSLGRHWSRFEAQPNTRPELDSALRGDNSHRR